MPRPPGRPGRSKPGRETPQGDCRPPPHFLQGMISTMTEFTPALSLLGGTLIGLSAVLLMAFHGRIAGMTGILAGILPLKADPFARQAEIRPRSASVARGSGRRS